ncbi:metallophosphoesterase [Xanthomonas phage JGB6]|nr:metallophosphoesterase [Xanthomonas phage JGB6]
MRRAVVETRAKDQCINWDKRVSEEQGLVKIDILGLSNLDVIEKAFNKIEHDTGKRIDILDIPLDDRKVLDAFGRGDTVGVFQFESSGMRKLLGAAKGWRSDIRGTFSRDVAVSTGPDGLRHVG